MPTPLTPQALVAQKIAETEAEVAKIHADAERRSAPLRLQIERLRIAAEVWNDLASAQEMPIQRADVVISGPAGTVAIEAKAPKVTTRQLIVQELHGSALPLSRSELVERFTAAGKTVLDATVGSTLSNMLRDKELVKHGNRYALPDHQTAAHQNKEATPAQQAAH